MHLGGLRGAPRFGCHSVSLVPSHSQGPQGYAGVPEGRGAAVCALLPLSVLASVLL